jgi:3-oxoadipate enol-lactonase
MNDLVQDLAEFLDWQCLERPTLFGVSFGGAVALEFASRFPGRLQALVVQGAGAHFEQGLLQQVAGLVLDQYPLPSDNPFVNQFFNLLFGKRERQGALVDFVTRRCWQTDQGVMAHRFRLIEHHNLDGRLGRIDVPTLVLAGERDLMVSPASLEALNAGLPDARCRRLEGCGHLAFVTRPGRVASEVTDFCDGL